MLKKIFCVLLVIIFFTAGCGKKCEEWVKKPLVRTKGSVIDEEFASSFADTYKKLNFLADDIRIMIQDLENRIGKLSESGREDALGEGILLLRASVVGVSAIWIVKYGSDMVELYSRGMYQYDDFYVVDKRLNHMVNALASGLGDLDALMSVSTDESQKEVYSLLRDKIKEAMDLLEVTKMTLEEKYRRVRSKANVFMNKAKV